MHEPQLKLYVARHAETNRNVDAHLICGRSHREAINAHGVGQAKRLGRYAVAAGLHIDFVSSSPAWRCLQTASHALAEIGSQLEPVVDERLQEVSQGAWEGRDRREVYSEAVIREILADPEGFRAPGGESIREAGDRMLDYMAELAQAQAVDGQPATGLVFGHGFVTRIAAGRIQGGSVEQMRSAQTPNTSLSLFVYDGRQWEVEFLGRDAASLVPG